MDEWNKQEIAVAKEPASTPKKAAPKKPAKSAKPATAAKKTTPPADTADSTPKEPAKRRTAAPKSAPAKKRTPKKPKSPPRTAANGARRGKYRFAAWIGLVVILFALFGVATLVTLGVRAIQKSFDHSDLLTELSDIAAPLIEYPPEPFESIDKADPEDLMLAAIYRLKESDRVWQLQNNTETSQYQTDEYGRLIIGAKEVNASFAALYGDEIQPVHQTLNQQGGVAYTYEYDKTNAWYHVPPSASASIYTAVADDIQVSGKTATLRVGYVPTASLGYDHRGELNKPTADQFTTYRYFTFTQAENGWILTKLAQETLATTPQTTTTAAGESTTVRTIATTTTATETTATTAATTAAEE